MDTLTSGIHEYWVCCKCHEHFLTKPSVGTYTDSSSIYSGGVPADAILPAGTKYYAKGAQIAADSRFDPKVNDLSALENKAISFNFKMTENGSVGLVLFDSSWANVTGDIVFTKNNDTTTVSKGVVTPKDNGWYNVCINKSEFNGDGLSRATDISIVAGLWGGSATVNSPVPLAVNWSTFEVTNEHRSLVTGNDVLQPFGTITSSELQNKALSFDVYYGADGDQTVKYSIYKDGWEERFIADIFVKRVGKDYEESVMWAEKAVSNDNPDGYWILALAYRHGVVLPSVIEAQTDNWVNVKINAEYLNIESTLGNKIIVWASPTSSKNGVDISSFKVVDATTVSERNYIVDTANLQSLSNVILMKNLINAGGYAFNIKMSPNTSSKISFMNGNWSNFGTSYFVCNSTGIISCYHDEGHSIKKGKLTKLSNGWTRVIFNEYDFYGDGRSALGAEGINSIFVENGNISFDENSFHQYFI